MVLTNRRIGAEEAVAIGLVTRMVPDKLLVGEGDRLAQSLATGATGGFATARCLLHRSYSAPLADHLEVEAAGIVAAARSQDTKARFAAFSDKVPS